MIEKLHARPGKRLGGNPAREGSNVVTFGSMNRRKFASLLLVVGILSSAASVVRAEIIPTTRRPNWQANVNVGVPGGIPNRTVIYQTLNPGDDIGAAINSCPPG